MKAFSLKLHDADLELLAARAAAAGEKPATFARRLLLAALKSGAAPAAASPPAAGPSATKLPADTLRRAVWCLLVGLSPDLDEDRARAFVEAYFDAPNAPGYAPPRGRAEP